MRNSLLFDTFTEAEYDALISAADFESLASPEDSIILYEGDEVGRFWHVDEGSLHAVRQYYDGSVDLVQSYNPEDYLGLDLIFTRTRRSPLQVVAASDIRLTAISSDIFFTSAIDVEIREKLVRNALRLLANESIRKQVKIDVLYKRSLRARICVFLCHMRDRFGSDDFEINMNREQLAQYLGVNRSALSNEISKMRDENLIRCRKGHFVILDSALCDERGHME
jgi:CRP-like cAMP-binding protein